MFDRPAWIFEAIKGFREREIYTKWIDYGREGWEGFGVPPTLNQNMVARWTIANLER